MAENHRWIGFLVAALALVPGIVTAHGGHRTVQGIPGVKQLILEGELVSLECYVARKLRETGECQPTGEHPQMVLMVSSAQGEDGRGLPQLRREPLHLVQDSHYADLLNVAGIGDKIKLTGTLLLAERTVRIDSFESAAPPKDSPKK